MVLPDPEKGPSNIPSTPRPNEAAESAPSIVAETERLLSLRTRDIRLVGPLLRFYQDRSWPQRAKIVRAWMVWVSALSVLMVAISQVIIPDLLWPSILISVVIVPASHGAVWLFWRRPRPPWQESLSLVLLMAATLFAYGSLGAMAGGPDHERYLTGALFLVAVALMVFGIELVWTMVLCATALAIFLGFQLVNPSVAWPTALALTLFYGMGLVATVVARRTATILAQRSFLMSLRDRHRREALAEANAQLVQLATMDPLTGVANRRSATAHIERLWADPTVDKEGVAFIMADIDHFKQLNDSSGHAVGDTCIRDVAATIRDSIRAGSDMVSRYGGEEFLVVLTDATPALATGIAERIRCEVEKLAIPNPGVPAIGQNGGGYGGARSARITISLGIACGRQGVGVERVAKWADDALYEAKRRGRNRVCSSAG